MDEREGCGFFFFFFGGRFFCPISLPTLEQNERRDLVSWQWQHLTRRWVGGMEEEEEVWANARSLPQIHVWGCRRLGPVVSILQHLLTLLGVQTLDLCPLEGGDRSGAAQGTLQPPLGGTCRADGDAGTRPVSSAVQVATS